jgi:Tol biopolymer transport system component
MAMRRLIALATGTGMLLVGLGTVGGQGARATTPGTNGPIVFSSDLGLGGEIYVIKRSGAGLQQLTEIEGNMVNAFSPDWSPDGGRIAFSVEDDSGGVDGVYVMDADGSNLQLVTAPGGQPAFTPDGDHLVYECVSLTVCDPFGIFLMNADGSDAPGVRLTSNPFPDEGDHNPEVSPDGQTVTFVRDKVDGELQALFAVDIDGTNERKIVPYRYEVAIKHDWAPNGKRIVITPWADFPDGHVPSLATVRPDGSDLRFLTRPQGDKATFAGSYSPDGRWIVYRFQNAATSVYRLMKIRPDASSRTVIATLPFSPRFIDWGVRAT